MRLLAELRARPGLLVVFLVVAIGLGLLAMYYSSLRRSQAELAAVLAETDALEPEGWKLEDLLRQQPFVPESENAALVLLAAKKHWLNDWPCWKNHANRVYDGTEFIWDFEQLWDSAKNPANVLLPTDQFNVLRNEVCRIHGYVEAVRKVAGMPRGFFPPPALSSPVWNTRLPHIEQIVITQEAIPCSALVRMQEGELDLAVEDVMALLNIAHSLDSEVFYVSYSLRSSLIWRASQLTERVLGHGTITDESLFRLQRTFADLDRPDPLVAALRGERAFCYRILEELLSGQTTSSQIRALFGAPSKVPFLELFMDWSVRGRSTVVEPCIASIRNCNQLIELVKDEERLRGEYETLRQKYDQWRNPTKPRYNMSSLKEIFQGPQYSLVLRYLRTSALLRTSETALAAERYRLRHGSWPEKLADLVPEFLEAVPTDPFDGQPLRWRPTAEGRVVYSVGFDREDNGGIGGPGWMSTKAPRDIVTRLYDPAFRRQPVPEDGELLPPSEPPPER